MNSDRNTHNNPPFESPIKRMDFDSKVDGSALFTADYTEANVYHAVTVRSSKPKAKILSISYPQLPTGYLIVDHKDITGKNYIPVVYEDWPVFAESSVNYIGEPIGLLVGPDKTLLQALANQVVIEYDTFKPSITLSDAMQSPPDLFMEYQKGDFDRVSTRAVQIIEDVYESNHQEHVYLEPQSMFAVYEAPILTIRGSMQCPYYIKDALITALGWSEDRIRVIQMPTGGAFGGKEEFPSVLGVHAGLAAIKSGHPVKLIYNRHEDMCCSTKRHPSSIKLTTYLDENHHIIARAADIKLDMGAYRGLSSVVLQRMSFSIFGAYNIEHLHVKASGYLTNKVISGAFRGFGGPQAFFAIESHTNHVASVLNVNPIDLRKRHFLKKGDTSSTGGLFFYPIMLDSIVDNVTTRSNFRDKVATNRPLHGIGLSVFFHGCGFTGSGEKELLKSKVTLKKHADNRVEIFASSTEMGQGSLTTLTKIVAHALDIPMSQVVHHYPDTATCPDSGPTVASRTIMIVGKILYDLALELKARWHEGTFEVSKIYQYPANLVWNNRDFQGNAYPEYSWGANVVEVQVDPDTYEVAVVGAWATFDIGTPIDIRIVQGQIEGGFLQGLGMAGMERITIKDGKLVESDLSKYIIPGFGDFVPVEYELIENPFEEGPFGARGLGELTLVGVPAAYASAVSNAIGVQVKKIPITPEDIRGWMHHDKP